MANEIGPTLETERLILRPPSAADFDAYCALMEDPETHFIGGPQVPAAAWRGLASIIGAWTLSGHSMFSFVEKSTGRWIGRGGPWFPHAWPGPEVGWAVIADVRGKGYAKEAAAAAIDWAFESLGWTEVIHCIDPKNAPSIGVARALGSDLLRTRVQAPAPFSEIYWDLYGQSRAQWRARRR